MQESWTQTVAIIGDSASAEVLRRWLVRRRTPHLGVAFHLRGLRKAVVLATDHPVTVCISLDERTLRRYGWQLSRFLADRSGFAAPIVSIGLLGKNGLSSKFASVGCDVYVSTAHEAARILEALDQTWRHRSWGTTAGLSRFTQPMLNEMLTDGEECDSFGDLLTRVLGERGPRRERGPARSGRSGMSDVFRHCGQSVWSPSDSG